jgi:uncharacterized protein involved in outer membrane biogenesis
MKTWQRTALRTAGALVALLVLAFIAARVLVNPEKLKAVAIEKARATWSRDLAIGALELGFFPVPWIQADNVTFANPEWATERHFFHADRITAHLALLPLIGGNVKLKSVFIEGGKASLEVSKDGHGTWELAKPDAAAKPESPATRRDNLLELRRLRFENFTIDDRRKPGTPHVWQVKEASLLMVPVLRDVHLEAEVARDGHPLKVKAKLDDFSHFGEPGATTPGRIEFDWGGAKLTLAGHMPLEPSLEGHRLHGDLAAPALGDMLGFFGYKRQPRAPIEAHFDMTGSKGAIRLDNLAIAMGKTRATGTADVRLGAKTVYDLKLASDDVDWSKALEDAGGNARKGVPEGEVLPATPMGWGMLEALKNKKGSVDAQIGRVKLGNGLELKNVKTRMTFEDDRLDVASLTTEMLGGTASFKARLEGRARRGHLELDGRNLLLERWFKERGKKIPFEGGPMAIKASLDSKGESMKQLAANMSGPVTIRMGRGVYASERAEEAEALLSSTSNGGPTGIRFECVGANLPFRNGRATHTSLVGATSDVSRLITSGAIDFREQKIELRGRLKPRSGIALATVVGDLRIFGPMAKPHISIDHPTALARLGAAIATAGLATAATAIADNSTKDANPCEDVFAAG